MMDLILQGLFKLISSFVGTFGFAIFMHAPKRAWLPASAIGGAAYTLYWALLQVSMYEPMAMFLAALVGSMLGQYCARRMQMIASIFVLLAMIPLVPGLGLYRFMSYLAQEMYGAGADFFYLKGMIVSLLNKLGVKDLQFIAESEYGVYHPGRCARIVARHIVELENGPAVEEVELGIMGEVHPEVADKYGIGTRCYAAELMFNTVTELSDLEKVFSPLPKYPATSRDIALLVDEDMLVGDIENVIRAAGTEILRDVKLFDIYRGKQVEEGKKSVEFGVSYRHNDRTLTDEDVNAAHGQVLQALRDNLDAVLREM